MATAPTPFDRLKVKDEAHWLEIRKTGVGGSDAPVVAGLSPWKSPLQLWMEKTGATEPEDISDVAAVRWGNILEPVLAAEYAKRNPSVKVRRESAVLRSKEYPFMLATLDRLVTCPERGRGGLEIKTAGFFPGQTWGEDGADDGVPDHYQLQVQHYLEVTRFDFFDVAVLIGGQDDRYYTIMRDAELGAALAELEGRFWDLVVTNRMPDLTGHSDEASALLAMFPNANKDAVLDLSDDAEAVRWATEYLEGHQTEANGKALKDRAKSNLKALMGEAAKVKVGTATCNWSRFPKKKVDLDGITAEVPDVVARHTSHNPSERFTVTPGKA